MMSRSTRRDFLAATFGAAALTRLGAQPKKRLATDWVTLGKSNVKVTRLALGTGTFGGRVPAPDFGRRIHPPGPSQHDRGIRFFRKPPSYRGMPEMLGIALKGLPRESYTLMTKCSTPGSGSNPGTKIDDFRRQLQSEYIDILLLHCLRPPTWENDYRSLQDGFSEAKSKKVIHSHGASVHGLPALRTIPGNQWLDLMLMRTNHNGTKMDTTDQRDVEALGNVDEVTAHVKKIHSQGMGVIGMKLCGEGRFTPKPRTARPP